MTSDIFKNTIIAPPALYAQLKAKGYNKPIYPEPYCPNDRWYYFALSGKLRTVLTSGGVWTAVLDEDGWPTFNIRRLR